MSPTEAPDACEGEGEHVQLARRIARGLASSLNAFVIDKRLDNYEKAVKIVSLLNMRQLILVKDLGALSVIYIDRSALERRCMYDSCASIDNRAEKELCARKCASETLASLLPTILKNLCDAARALDQQAT